MNSFKQQCITLRKKDYTLDEIVACTGRSKTSVYFHIKNIPLSRQKVRAISAASRERGKQVAALRKGKALRPYVPFHKWTTYHVLLVSHLLFGGEIIRGRCTYSNRSRTLVEHVQQLMSRLYTHPGFLRTHTQSGVLTVTYYNIELQNFLHKKSQELLANVLTMPRAYQCEFVRAFFDDEGCMDANPRTKMRRIRGYQKDREILHLIQMLLKNFDIEARLQGKNEVVITRKENLKQFQQEINFSKGVCVNSKRKNSIWKEPIEKRELLNRAIRSFNV